MPCSKGNISWPFCNKICSRSLLIFFPVRAYLTTVIVLKITVWSIFVRVGCEAGHTLQNKTLLGKAQLRYIISVDPVVEAEAEEQKEEREEKLRAERHPV